jgi:DNA polymerase I
MMEATNLLKQALEYEQRKLCLIPLASKSKRPQLQNWEKYQSMVADQDQLTQWFSNSENSYYPNIGIVTGTVSKIFAIDIDGKEAQERFQSMIDDLGDTDITYAINNTFKIRTGSGNINIVLGFSPEEFASINGDLKSKILWRSSESGHSEIRIKGEGGYIVAPPSIHPNGNRYELVTGLDIITFSKEHILKLLTAFSSKKNRHREIVDKEHPSHLLDDETVAYVVEILRPYYQPGIRNDFIMPLSGWLRKENVSIESARKVIDGLTEDDEEKQGRFTTLEATYNKANLDDVSGYIGLLTTISSITSNEKAVHILNELAQLISPNYHHELNGFGSKKSQSKQLIEIAESTTDLSFSDQYGAAFTKVRVGNHYEIIPIMSSRFSHYITKQYFDYHNGKEIPNQESLNNAIRVLAAKTEFGNQRRTVYLRSAWGRCGEINYDLTDEEWRQIEITKDGWRIIKSNDSGTFFTRFNQTSQVEPDRNYSSNIFDKYLDMMIISDQQHRLLLKVLTICYFVPDIPHPICIPYGEQGSCKSTFSEFQKRLIDPSKTNLLTIPKDKSEFVQQLHHNYLVTYDNTRYLPPWFSDEVCKAVTGVGNSKRKLYSDDEDVIVNYRRCIIINGINNNLTEPDALDRSILIEFERIPKELRKEESKIEIQFEEIRPKLLGYIFDVLVRALQIKADLELTHLPRMADFAVWGEAIARAMGYKPMEFIDIYNKNIGRQNIELIESNQLAQTIEKFVQSWCIDGREACWTSSTSKVLDNLNRIAQQYNIDTSGREWPRASNSLTKRLRPLLTNLREGLGIHFIVGRTTTGSNKNKNISIIKIWKESPLSPLSPLSPPVQEHPLNLSQSGGGSIVSGDCASAEQYVSPLQIGQNHAQNLESGGSGGSGGYVSNLVITDASSYPNVLADRYVAFDFEWSSQVDQLPNQITAVDTPIQITAAAFVDNLGNKTVLHITDFYDSDNPEYELLLNIVQELTKYEYSIGWYSTGVALYHEDTQEYLDGIDSDLAILHSRCIANGIDSIINLSSGIPYINGQTHIDLHSVFGKPMVQTSILKNAYRTLKLDEVSKAVLKNDNSNDTGKYKQLTGRDIHKLTVEEQKAYVLRDSELVMQLSKHNNSEVLDAMKAVAEVTGLDFERVCRTGISTWWAAIYDQAIVNGESQLHYHSNTNTSVQDYDYKGAIVLEPKRGIYHDLVVVDVVSLYPSMAVLHNISFDTINCECCRDNLEARIPEQISMLLNSDLDNRNNKRDYWICKRSEGIFPKKLRLFKEERIRQKELGNSVKQLALKILINGGYGVFGSKFFKYYDPKVAELITAYGRHTLTMMQEIAKEMGLRVVYGDTDSLFIDLDLKKQMVDSNIVNRYISEFKEKCRKLLGIEVEHAKTYKTSIILDKKKHYIGWTGIPGVSPDIVGMEGDKNDRPKWINDVFRRIVDDILGVKGEINNPISTLKKALSDLELGRVNHELLTRSVKLSKNPEEYHNLNDRKRRLGIAVGAKKGDVIEYYESDNSKEGYSLNYQDISIRKYKLMLWKAIREVLEIAGYEVRAVENKIGVTSRGR